MPPTRRDAANAASGLDAHAPFGTWIGEIAHHANIHMLAGREMEGDVAAVIDESAPQRRCLAHGAEHRFSDGACDRDHRRDEGGAVRPRGLGHAPRDRATERRACVAEPGAQERQFGNELGEQPVKAPRRRRIGALDLENAALRLDHEVDRPVIEVQPPARKGRGDHRGAPERRSIR